MTQADKIIAAAVYGTIAFNEGRPSTPCLDKDCMALLAGNKMGEGIPVLKSFTNSWHAANLVSEVK